MVKGSQTAGARQGGCGGFQSSAPQLRSTGPLEESVLTVAQLAPSGMQLAHTSKTLAASWRAAVLAGSARTVPLHHEHISLRIMHRAMTPYGIW